MELEDSSRLRRCGSLDGVSIPGGRVKLLVNRFLICSSSRKIPILRLQCNSILEMTHKDHPTFAGQFRFTGFGLNCCNNDLQLALSNPNGLWL